jgi:surface antigen
LFVRVRKQIIRLVTQRRFVRYGLLALNIVLLGGIVWFVAQSSPGSQVATTNNQLASSSIAAAPSDPLDQLSSADIAVNLARMADLPEAIAVINQADSVRTELAAPAAYTSVLPKPQIVATTLKGRGGIKSYVVQSNDTVPKVAAKFNVTSDSVRWSNDLTGDALTVGKVLFIPPVNGIVYTVQSGDTPQSLAQKYRANKEQIIAYNDAELSGLRVGEKIIIPNGQPPAPVVRSSSYYGFSWGTTAVYGFNGYDPGFCTWYVANKRIEICRPLPANLGNAYTWDDRARMAGFTVVYGQAAKGAAVVTDTFRNPGHVAYVEEVYPDGRVRISEMNKNWVRFQVTSRTMSAAEAAGYNYIY